MKYYLKLARIGNVIITFLSVECAGILCGVDIAKSWEIFVAAIAASLITAGGNAVNDLFDMDIDKINRPYRPLVSGKLSTRQAKIFYFVVTTAGLIASAGLSFHSFIIAIVAAVFIFMYSFKLKRSVFFGNFTVALVTGLTFIYAGAAVKDFVDVYPAAVFAFLTNLIREIIKDAEDVKGDGEIGVKTIATKFGTAASAYISIALTAILLFMVWGAFDLRILPIQFLTVCGLTILPIGAYISYLLISRRGFSEASFGYKLMMVFGLIALIVGKV
ncbi:MAG TPA: geranylgeranylglycerol-phosphate geranylgeranyltransferase [Candidatus Acidoferrales bacterium]|nr:geranylgeranylglycerol-phosphate geranylgeranyltransferase [Candidatus Acidoferrales bacterium]